MTATQGTSRSRPPLGAVVAGAAVVIAAAAFVPYLPDAPDVYAHLLWSWQVMRCLAAGHAPLWLPDLNAGFGSPGIRLYSPAGPVIEGALGLLLGTADAGLRAAAALAALALLIVAWRLRGPRSGALETGLLLCSPLALHSLLVRGAWSEFLAIPLLWRLLDDAVDGDIRPVRHAALLAALWLVHAPTTLMAVALLAAATLLRRDMRRVAALAVAGTGAAALTAWHWLPFADEARLVHRRALTEGLFEATRNALTSPAAHAFDVVVWLGWCAAALLGATLLGRWWRSDPIRTALLVGCVVLAMPLAAPLYHPSLPLAWLQFPWRWLLPAAALAVTPGARALADRRGKAPALVLLAPLLLFPWPGLARDPRLGRDTEWREAGERIGRAIGGNPLVVDVEENRPAAFATLLETATRFGPHRVLVDEPSWTRWRVVRWSPLERVVAVESPGSRVALRLLDYPRWEVTVDGRPAAAPWHAAVGAAMPPGEHVVRARWRGNPWSRVGQALAAAAALGMVLASLPRRRTDAR